MKFQRNFLFPFLQTKIINILKLLPFYQKNRHFVSAHILEYICPSCQTTFTTSLTEITFIHSQNHGMVIAQMEVIHPIQSVLVDLDKSISNYEVVLWSLPIFVFRAKVILRDCFGAILVLLTFEIQYGNRLLAHRFRAD